jgi:hypothetical protein
VNVNGPGDDGVRHLGVHDAQNRVNGLVPADAQAPHSCCRQRSAAGEYINVHHRAVREIRDVLESGIGGTSARPPTLMKI